ncbi:hypothetical protein [Paenibacillus sp. MBLB4367]|uniref:hypothetical protein n=1 Tax=Paenibacillus sp. MBLB4367 TaxID=3384767 RepID=UPI003907F283
MSEFSESYHLKTNRQEAVIHLLKESGNEGYVFEESNGWVTFVTKGKRFKPSPSVVFYNPGLLIHYVYAEDHGWELKIFDKDELVFDYKCDWTDDLTIEKHVYDIDIIKDLILEQGNSIENVEDLFDCKSRGGLLDQTSPAYLLAGQIGLSYFEWISVDYLEGRELEDNIVVVDA